ncbi:MAG: M14 family zinc carboxypeptidase [Flavobacteriaceae bacterium]
MKSNLRYYPPEKWAHDWKKHSFDYATECIGYSVQQRAIEVIYVGNGPVKVLMWSQMHGNESSSTRALVQLLDHYRTAEGVSALAGVQLAIIPQLNPDGAALYTRLNAQQQDLNRDAQALSQPESVVLQQFCQQYQPHYAFNLHGQRTIFGAGLQGRPATLSFLAPAGDAEKNITKARLKAMHLIADIRQELPTDLDEAVGRYDDAFNLNCVGDTFTQLGIPTLLFESGHYPQDYDRTTTVNFTFQALKAAILRIQKPIARKDPAADYHKIPENTKDWVDLMLHPVTLVKDEELMPDQFLFLQYEEQLKEGSIEFKPVFHSISPEKSFKPHTQIQFNNKNEVFQIGEKDLKSWNYNNLLMNYL